MAQPLLQPQTLSGRWRLQSAPAGESFLVLHSQGSRSGCFYVKNDVLLDEPVCGYLRRSDAEYTLTLRSGLGSTTKATLDADFASCVEIAWSDGSVWQRLREQPADLQIRFLLKDFWRAKMQSCCQTWRLWLLCLIGCLLNIFMWLVLSWLLLFIGHKVTGHERRAHDFLLLLFQLMQCHFYQVTRNAAKSQRIAAAACIGATMLVSWLVIWHPEIRLTKKIHFLIPTDAFLYEDMHLKLLATAFETLFTCLLLKSMLGTKVGSPGAAEEVLHSLGLQRVSDVYMWQQLRTWFEDKARTNVRRSRFTGRAETFEFIDVYEAPPQPDLLARHHAKAADLGAAAEPSLTSTPAADFLARRSSAWLLHGTKLTSLRGILQKGFRLPFKWGFGMYGPGIYFAEAPQKCSAYAGNLEDGSVLLIMTSVILGRCKPMNEAAPAAGPRAVGLRDLNGRTFQSVVGLSFEEEGSLTWREFAVYSADQALPRYVFRARAIEAEDV